MLKKPTSLSSSKGIKRGEKFNSLDTEAGLLNQSSCLAAAPLGMSILLYNHLNYRFGHTKAFRDRRLRNVSCLRQLAGRDVI
jgi:hypothetical protein